MKLEFTNLELNAIYRKALETFESNRSIYTCINLKMATIDLFGEKEEQTRKTYFTLLSENFKTVYKHFCNFAPVKNHSQDVWFKLDEEGRQQRIEILKKCIELTNQ